MVIRQEDIFMSSVYKKGGKDQESIQSSTTTIPHRKVTKTQLNITNKSQEVSPFPAGDHKVAMNRHESMIKQDINNTNVKHVIPGCGHFGRRIIFFNKLGRNLLGDA